MENVPKSILDLMKSIFSQDIPAFNYGLDWEVFESLFIKKIPVVEAIEKFLPRIKSQFVNRISSNSMKDPKEMIEESYTDKVKRIDELLKGIL
jgi:hypothetical protein